MSAWPEPASFFDALPRTIKYCKRCLKATPHEIRHGRGLGVAICIRCLERALASRLNATKARQLPRGIPPD